MRINVNPFTGKEDIERRHLRTKRISADYTLNQQDELITLSSDRIVTLPTLIHGRVLYIQKIGNTDPFEYTITVPSPAKLEVSQGNLINGLVSYRVNRNIRTVILWGDKPNNTWRMQVLEDIASIRNPNNYTFSEEFLSNPVGSVLEFDTLTTGGGSAVLAATQPGAPGIVNYNILSGISSAVRAVMYTGTLFDDARLTEVSHRFKLGTLSVVGTRYLWYCGYIQDNVTDFDAVPYLSGFLYDNNNESTFNPGLITNWIAIHKNGATISVYDTGIAADTTDFHQFRVESSNLEFLYYIDNVYMTTFFGGFPGYFESIVPQIRVGHRLEKDTVGAASSNVLLDSVKINKVFSYV